MAHIATEAMHGGTSAVGKCTGQAWGRDLWRQLLGDGLVWPLKDHETSQVQGQTDIKTAGWIH